MEAKAKKYRRNQAWLNYKTVQTWPKIKNNKK
jgi:hypothetical protein